MSASDPRELMILVERVVRPLPLPLSRQKRLRADFLEHLQAIYADELARDGEPAAALNRTQQRFGDSAALTSELRGPVQWRERCEFWLERSMAQRRNESAIWYAARITGRFGLFLFLCIGSLIADNHLFGTAGTSSREWMVSIRFALATSTFLSVWLGGFLLFGLTMGEEWERYPRRWGRIFPCSLGLIATWPASLWILMQMAAGSWPEYAFAFLFAIVGGQISVIGGTFVGVVHRRETLYRREWAELKLDAA